MGSPRNIIISYNAQAEYEMKTLQKW